MHIHIREFNRDDYEAMTAVNNAIYTEYPYTAAQWQREDENRSSNYRWNHLVALVDGRLVGVGSYWQNMWDYHPQKFQINVRVHPAFQRRGTGSAVYEQLLEVLKPLDPRLLRARTREDFDGAIPFLVQRGFVETDRDFESRLDPSTVETTAYEGLAGKLEQSGIAIKTLAELRDRDPDYAQRVYELDWATSQDVPVDATPTKPSFEDYCKTVLEQPRMLPDAWFIAVHSGVYVGTSNLWASEAGEDALYTGFTGVHRDYRRRGIALALKLQAIAYAQAQGVGTIKTWNAAKNRPMLSINEQLGFVRQPAWINLEKEIRD